MRPGTTAAPCTLFSSTMQARDDCSENRCCQRNRSGCPVAAGVMAAAELEGQPAVRPLNAPVTGFGGRGPAQVRSIDGRHTLSVSPHTRLQPSGGRWCMPPSFATAVAGGDCRQGGADRGYCGSGRLRLIHRRLTPGWELAVCLPQGCAAPSPASLWIGAGRPRRSRFRPGKATPPPPPAVTAPLTPLATWPALRPGTRVLLSAASAAIVSREGLP